MNCQRTQWKCEINIHIKNERLSNSNLHDTSEQWTFAVAEELKLRKELGELIKAVNDKQLSIDLKIVFVYLCASYL